MLTGTADLNRVFSQNVFNKPRLAWLILHGHPTKTG